MLTSSNLRAAAVAVAALLCTGVAEASNYRLADAEITSVAETRALAAEGIADTATLFQRAHTRELRKGLAARAKLDAGRLEVLAVLCDVLRVDGIGPTMARALGRVGVSTVAALRTEDAERLQARLEADARKQAGPNADPMPVPPVELLAKWIASAAALPLRLER